MFKWNSKTVDRLCISTATNLIPNDLGKCETSFSFEPYNIISKHIVFCYGVDRLFSSDLRSKTSNFYTDASKKISTSYCIQLLWNLLPTVFRWGLTVLLFCHTPFWSFLLHYLDSIRKWLYSHNRHFCVNLSHNVLTLDIRATESM